LNGDGTTFIGIRLDETPVHGGPIAIDETSLNSSPQHTHEYAPDDVAIRKRSLRARKKTE
jgi:hypothetical protein